MARSTPPATSPKPLTPRELRFVEAYVGGMPAGRAYEAAGYKARGDSADSNALRLLGKEKVVAAVESHRSNAVAKIELTAERWARELAHLAFSDVRKLFGPNGRLKSIHELDDATAAAVASLEVIEDPGSRNRAPTVTSKIKIGDKIKALELLGKYLRLYTDHVEHEHTGNAPGSGPTTIVNVFGRIDELVSKFRQPLSAALAHPAGGSGGDDASSSPGDLAGDGVREPVDPGSHQGGPDAAAS